MNIIPSLNFLFYFIILLFVSSFYILIVSLESIFPAFIYKNGVCFFTHINFYKPCGFSNYFVCCHSFFFSEPRDLSFCLLIHLPTEFINTDDSSILMHLISDVSMFSSSCICLTLPQLKLMVLQLIRINWSAAFFFLLIGKIFYQKLCQKMFSEIEAASLFYVLYQFLFSTTDKCALSADSFRSPITVLLRYFLNQF